MGSEGGKMEIVRTIVSLAHSLNMDVVAEGVETAEQRAGLLALACEYAQGYLYSRPLTKADMERFLLSPRRPSPEPVADPVPDRA
jgi:EAL domain-containing protein (putative c-di-GMP-specific phosphodiesterase class I)